MHKIYNRNLKEHEIAHLFDTLLHVISAYRPTFYFIRREIETTSRDYLMQLLHHSSSRICHLTHLKARYLRSTYWNHRLDYDLILNIIQLLGTTYIWYKYLSTVKMIILLERLIMLRFKFWNVLGMSYWNISGFLLLWCCFVLGRVYTKINCIKIVSCEGSLWRIDKTCRPSTKICQYSSSDPTNFNLWISTSASNFNFESLNLCEFQILFLFFLSLYFFWF